MVRTIRIGLHYRLCCIAPIRAVCPVSNGHASLSRSLCHSNCYIYVFGSHVISSLCHRYTDNSCSSLLYRYDSFICYRNHIISRNYLICKSSFFPGFFHENTKVLISKSPLITGCSDERLRSLFNCNSQFTGTRYLLRIRSCRNPDIRCSSLCAVLSRNCTHLPVSKNNLIT